MSFSPAEEFDVLHGVRIKGIAQPKEIAAAVGLDQALVERVLDDAVDKEHARERSGGRVQGYMLTVKGRERHEKLRTDNVPDRNDDLVDAYDEFLAPNRDFKAVTTKWQTEANGDPSVVLPELIAIDESVGKVLTLASGSVPRMQSYIPRFKIALNAFKDGETSALARPMSGSYHDVWMELHEDLLLILGRERTDADE
jgi:predicted transcriptional regulator